MKFLQNSKCHQRRNRRGGMLVLVLIIFAVSLILISSAMTITLASRSRYYVDTERSQERLTLSCAAEAVIDALEKQELTDSDLQKMVNTGVYKIAGSNKMAAADGASATDGKNIAPGLAQTGDSYTVFEVTRVSEGSEDLFITFSTCINATDEDKNTENLRVRLKYNPPQPVQEVCPYMATFGDPNSSEVVDVQMLYVNTTKSYTVLHGNVNITAAGETYIKNPTVITGTALGQQGTIYHNDVIFYGPDAGINVTNPSGNGFQIGKGEGDLYFIGATVNGNSNTQSVFRNSDGSAANPSASVNVTADGMYLNNASFKASGESANFNGAQGVKYIVADSGSSFTRTTSGGGNIVIKNGSGTVSSSNSKVYESNAISDAGASSAYTRMKNKATQYITDGELKAAATHSIPTSEQYATTYGKYCKGAVLTPSDLNNKTVNKDGGQAYQMSGTYSNGSLLIDLSKGTATIYMSSSVTFNSFNIRVSNAYDAQLIVVLAKGAKLTFSPPYMGNGSFAGIVACDNRNSNDFAGKLYAGNNALSGKEGEKPACLMIGLGSNTLEFGQSSVLDAYVSLAGVGEEGSTIYFNNCGAGAYFYGRLEAVSYHYQNGNPVQLAYCPSMSEEDSTPKPLSSCYTVEGYEYTYDV